MTQAKRGLIANDGLATKPDDPATRLVASKIIELTQRGVRDAPTLSAMILKEFKHY
jgi:hypothetical protein